MEITRDEHILRFGLKSCDIQIYYSSSSSARVLLSTAWPHYISGQVLSSHSVVPSSRTVRPCSPLRGRWIGHWRTTWSTVCSSAPHSQAAEEVVPHLYKQEQKCTTPVRRQLSQTQALLGGSFQDCGYRCLEWKCRVLWGCPPMAYGGHFGRGSTGSQPAQNCEGSPVVVAPTYHKPFKHLNRLAVEHNNQTTRSTYPRTSKASGTNKNWSFLVTKSFQLKSLIRNK